MSMARKKKASRRKSAPVYEERGFSLSMPTIVRERPLDSFALFMASAAAAAITFNAIMLQDGGRAARPQSSSAPAAAVPTPQPAPASIAELVGATTRDEDPNMLVREVQAELARRGLYDGPADGLFGPKTEAAIFDFEIGAGLKPTGRPNPQLLAAMRSNNGPAVAPSPRVVAVQRVLDQQGFGPVKADGVVGEATRAAIRRFEASLGLPQKGEISSALLQELSEISGVSFD